jgi:hypothetical protein
LEARAEYAVNELTVAAKLRPGDRRIDGWLAGARVSSERMRYGATSSKSLQSVLDAIPVRPTFNLWTALILFNQVDASSPLYDRLAGEAKRFVDSVSAGADPCKERPRDCRASVHAPYNFQGALTMLGDVFLRRAEYFLKKGDIPRAMQMAGYAKGVYSQLDAPDQAKATKSWREREGLTVRQERVATVLERRLPKGDLVNSEAYRQVYECASCHGRVNH